MGPSRSTKEEGPRMSTRTRAATEGRAGGGGAARCSPAPAGVAKRREPAAWEDPAGRALASLRAGGVPVAERRLLAGEPIYAEGDPDGGLYFVVAGSARVYKRYGPRKLGEATVALVGGGGVFGEPALEGARPHRDNAEAGLEVGPEGGRLTQELLAGMVACNRVTVSKEVASLRREGVLGVGERGGVVVLDREALARAARPAFTRMRA